MVIKGNFQIGGDQIEVIVDSDNIMFRDTSLGTITTIDGLRLSKAGVIKEHPDLKDDTDWKIKAIERLKKHVKTFTTEMEKMEYIKDELKTFGYEPLFFQRAGFRPRRFNGN